MTTPTSNQELPPILPEDIPSTEAELSLWPAFWFGLAAALSFMAAMHAFNHDGRDAIRVGVLVLIANLVAIALNKLKTAQIIGHPSWFARMHSTTLALLGFGLFSLSYAIVLHLTIKGWRGVDLFSDLYLWADGAISMSLAFALTFALLAIAHAFYRGKLNWSSQRLTLSVISALALVFLLGPSLTIERIDSAPEVENRSMLIKQSLLAKLKNPNSEQIFLKTETVSFGYEEPKNIICVAQTRSSFLLFSWQKAKEESEASTSYDDKTAYLNKINTCASQTKAALSAGTAIEAHLYVNKLDDFFSKLQLTSEDQKLPALGVKINKLPEPLKTQLTDLLPQAYRWNFTAFDVALASKRSDDVVATMPNLDEVLPHQRQALFDMGVFKTLENVVGETDASLAQKRHENYQTQVDVGMKLGSAALIQGAMNSLLYDATTSNSYGNFKGGYTDFDYYMANRSCDIAYAKFLNSKQIPSNTQHILHLLSVMGRSQYPNLASEFEKNFSYADNSLGFPKEIQLNQCVELAKFYAETVKDFNKIDPYAESNNYQLVYDMANDAVFQWRLRDWEKKGNNGRVQDSTVHGDPAALVNAAAEVLKKQPASFEQFCAWSNHFHAWMYMVKDDQPNMVAAMVALPTQWKNAKVVYQQPEATCNFNAVYQTTNEYTTPAEGLKYGNLALKQAGIPCLGSIKDSASQLTCNVKTEPWPQPQEASAE